MKTAYCYFSASGNGLDIANQLNEKISGDIIYIKNADMNALKEYKRIMIITPLYSFGPAIPVAEFINKVKGVENTEFYVVITFAGFSANSEYLIQNLFKENNLNLKNIYKVMMPVSFSTIVVPSEKMQDSILKKVPSRIKEIVFSINSGEKRIFNKNVFYFTNSIWEKNKKNLASMAKDFSVSENCIKCKKCIKVCPMNNIEMQEEKIVFKNNCCACLACYNQCPVKAISYKNKEVKQYKNRNIWGSLGNLKKILIIHTI